MPATIDQMISRVERFREEIDNEIVAGQAQALRKIFDTAERRLYGLRDSFNGLAVKAGYLERSVENIQEAARIVEEDVMPAVDRWVTGPGKAWGTKAMPIAHAAGRDLARMNLDVEFLSQELVDAAFRQVLPAEKALIVRGMQDTYHIVNTVGSEVGEWFRRELMDSVIEGIPVVSKTGGDSLMSRLFESGRIKPVTIRTESGKLYRRSVAARAEAIARIESAKVLEATHEVLAEAVIGIEPVFINTNPMDSRTTDICEQASRQDPMTLMEWSDSRFGRPPRLNPFHLCRSTLIGGRPEWFADRKVA